MDEVLNRFVSSSKGTLELVYSDNLLNGANFEMFNNVFMAKGLTRDIEEQVLHIQDETEDDSRMIVTGVTSIKEFIAGDVDCVVKERYAFDLEQQFNDYYDSPFVARLYSSEIEEDPEYDDTSLKTFCLMKRVRYSDRYCQYVAEVQKNGAYPARGLKESKASMANFDYVFKVVITNKEADIDKILRTMEFALNGNIKPLLMPKQQDVLKDYSHKIEGMVSERVRNIIGKDDVLLITPKPITLERMNLANPDNLGLISIMKNYAVTEKADGERFLLFFDEKGEGYLINNIKNVRGTGLVNSELSSSLFDGELILCNNRKNDASHDLFAIFDVYMVNGKHTKDLPLIPDRYDVMQRYVKFMKTTPTHEFMAKQQLYPSDNITILDRCNEILQNHDLYKYSIDGLVFTPMKLPVFGYYANKPVGLTPNMKWDRVFKWKPPDQNTIEFIIKETGVYHTYGDGNRYKEYVLYVGFNIENNEMIDVVTGLVRRYDPRYKPKSKDSIYELREFTIENRVQKTHIPVNENTGNCYTADTNELILDNSVVEFSYNSHNVSLSNERRWVPNRIRHDKNRIYNFGKGPITKTANDWDVAMNIWRSISKPITYNMITGTERIEFLESEADYELTSDDKYYNRFNDKDSSKLISSKMIMFHNRVIKPMLFNYPPMRNNNRGRLLELACGQGSDMDRWISSRYRFILGVDYVKDNIENPVSGVYKRLITKYQKAKKDNRDKYFPTMIFAIGDCKFKLDNGEAARGLDRDSEEVLKIVLGNRSHIPKRYKQISVLSEYHNVRFDVVSCMFSIHYFFEDERALDGFLSNVMNNLKENGMFICTFMDGKTVEERLNSNSGVLLGTDQVSDATVWAIRRSYPTNQKNPYGKKISVYIENSGKLIAENLVYFSLLENKCKQFGLTLEASEMFETTFNKTLNNDNSMVRIDPYIIDNLKELNKDSNLKEFSFFNRWTIFKKAGPQ